MFKDNNLIVYGDHEISLIKYPRKNTDKEITDIIIIIFLMHEDYLKKLGSSYENSIKFHNECKEYYYTFKFGVFQKVLEPSISQIVSQSRQPFTGATEKYIKNYTAQDILFLINKTNEYFRDNKNVNLQLNFLKNLQRIDGIYYFYIKNKDFYLKLFSAIEEAKNSHFKCKEFSYNIIPPIDFYGKTNSCIYSGMELMEINAYTQYLISKKIIKELPNPIYFNG
jgi:hypothetical protein